MSKTDVKKYIKSLERKSLEELVLDLYSARKEAKEYLEYVIFLFVNFQFGSSFTV